MDLLDIIILVAAVGYAIGGFRNGAVVGVFSLAGFLGGAVAGAQLGRPLATLIARGQGQVVVALVCVLLCALVGQLALVWVARRVRSRITWKTAQVVDSGIGSVLGVVSVLLVAWMVAVPLASSPYPSLASQARRSAIVDQVNDVVPNNLRDVYSSLQQFIDRSGFPQVFDSLKPTRIVDVDAPDTGLGSEPAVLTAAKSVLKIYGTAESCDRAIEGSGFVYAPGKVLTNAHVVAGTDRVTVQLTSNSSLTAHVVFYDPRTDLAVLNVPGLKVPPLPWATAGASSGDDAVVVGYPRDGPLTIGAARIRDQETISGKDIYGQGQVTRKIYSIRGTVISGNSGGPLITPQGSVLGMVFATALDSKDTGFVLTDSEIEDEAATGASLTEPVSTQDCS
jgi:S1-C subfamily serine protease